MSNKTVNNSIPENQPERDLSTNASESKVLADNSPPDSEEDDLDLKKLLDRCWTKEQREAAIRKLAEQAGKTASIAKLLLEYTYGKPSERYMPSEPDQSSLPAELDEAIRRIYGDDLKDDIEPEQTQS
ncbi:MAG TPA: hypothetical protein VFC63_21965 [Blastocatellia bacterium]|nr:hypothetical protein [Blastocatellia bacterium]